MSPSVFERQVYSVAMLCPDQSFLSLCRRRRVAVLSMLYKVISNSNHCLFGVLLPASTRVRHTRAVAAAHPLEFEISRCRTSQFARSFLTAQVRMWNDLPYTVFDTGTLDGNSRMQSTVGCFPELCFSFFSFPRRWCLWGCESNLYTTLFFSFGPVLLVLIIIIIIIIIGR